MIKIDAVYNKYPKKKLQKKKLKSVLKNKKKISLSPSC